jgi:PilZ domain-containing protein
MPEQIYANTRRTPRFPFTAEAEITLRDGSWLPAQLCELSSRGCYMDTLEPIPVGTELVLSICDGLNTCELPGRVIYEHGGGGLGITGMGVVFGEMQAQQHSTIDAWIESAATGTTQIPEALPRV